MLTIEFGDGFGDYVVIMNTVVAAIMAVGYLVLLFCIAYLANKEQPTPNWKDMRTDSHPSPAPRVGLRR
ncbi:hypothetical protein [Streptomyces collinus]|uniref:hypothetical protein n=1 Tax=Streptomyces collinus TaxID=42684 RepID=UPI0033F1559B